MMVFSSTRRGGSGGEEIHQKES